MHAVPDETQMVLFLSHAGLDGICEVLSGLLLALCACKCGGTLQLLCATWLQESGLQVAMKVGPREQARSPYRSTGSVPRI